MVNDSSSEHMAQSAAFAGESLKRIALDSGLDDMPGSARKPRGGSGPDAEDAWSCPKCGNFNYGGRLFCNMRKCNTAKPLDFAPSAQHPSSGLIPTLLHTGQQLQQPLQGFGLPPTFNGAGVEGLGQLQAAGFVGLHGVPQYPTSLIQLQQAAQQAQQAVQQAAQVAYQVQAASFDSQAGVAGAWVCPSCGSHNESGQLFCTSTSCGLAKPGLRAVDVVGEVGQVMTAPLSTQQAAAPVPSAYGTLGAFGSAFAGVDPNCLGVYGGHAAYLQSMQMPMLGFDHMAMALASAGSASQPPGQPREECGDFKRGLCTRGASCRYSHGIGSRVDSPRASDDKNPPGSWACSQCGNVNWPTRSTCNGKRGGAVCALQREQCEGPREVVKSSPPPGSWLCSACGNVNWPIRTTCNGKNCARMRDEVDGGAPKLPMVVAPSTAMPTQLPPQLSQTPVHSPPDGSWICHACQNVNWPTRTHCNRRTCGAQRMA